MAKKKKTNQDIVKNMDEDFTGVELCEKCGSELVLEDGKMICPACDTAIDFFGEEDE